MDVDPRVYREQVNEAIMFLKGRTKDLIAKIEQQMNRAAQAQEFEKAARLRDKMFSLQRTIEKQIAVTTDFKDRDVFAILRSKGCALVTVFNVVGGFLKGTRHFSFEETISTDEEAMGTFIRQYYEKPVTLPKEILVSVDMQDAKLIEDWFKTVKGHTVKILNPKRGEKAKLMRTALRNAANELKELLAARSAEMELLLRLQKKLKLSRLPERIECFDNSNIGATQAVASMVVFEKGKPRKSAYRKFKIKAVDVQDDYAYMHEVLSRRLGKLKSQPESEASPDLLMVDGGRGQLSIALAVIRELALAEQFDTIAIAKKDEKKGQTQDKIFKPHRANPIAFGKDADLLLFLQRIRDEAHRFAISFHRKRRSKAALQSELDGIPGVGKTRKTILLKHFNSIKKIREASIEQLNALPGIPSATAEAIHRYFHPESK
jgi:excinuclease ABC subunit C